MSVLNIFISYSSKNRTLVDVLANDLATMGYGVWYDRNLIGRTQEWWKVILENIRQCEVFVSALTPNSLRSDACKIEYEYARDLGKTIILVDLVGIDFNRLPESMREIQLITYREQSKENVLKLVEALNNRKPGQPATQRPQEPRAPSSPIAKLFDRVNVQSPLSANQQLAILGEIGKLFDNDREKDWIYKISDLLDEIEDRNDAVLTRQTSSEITRLRSSIKAALQPEPATIRARIELPLKPNEQLAVLDDIASLSNKNQFVATIPELLMLLEARHSDDLTIRASEKIQALHQASQEPPHSSFDIRKSARVDQTYRQVTQESSQPSLEVPLAKPKKIVTTQTEDTNANEQEHSQGCRRQFQITIGFTFVVIILLLFVFTGKPKIIDQFAANVTPTANQVALGRTATTTNQPGSTPILTLTVPIFVTVQTLTPTITLMVDRTLTHSANASRASTRTTVSTIPNTKIPSPITAPTSTRTPTAIPPTLAPTPMAGTRQAFEAVSANGFKTVVQVIYTGACLGTPVQCQHVWIDSELVTNAQYSICQQSDVCQLPVFSQEFYIPAHRSGLPVVGVNWAAANQFCRWRSERFPGPGRLPTKQERATATVWIKGPSDQFEWSATTAEGIDLSLTPAPKQKMFVFTDQERPQEEADRNLGFRCVLTTGALTSSK